MNWLTIITTLIAAIAPSIVSIYVSNNQLKINEQNNLHQLNLNSQNNEHQLNLKKLEYFEKVKINSLNDYFDKLATYLNNPTPSNLSSYQAAMSKVSLYVSKKVYLKISDINSSISEGKIDEVDLDYLLTLLNKEACENNQTN